MADASMTAQQAVDAHHNDLWNAVALLDAAADRIAEYTPPVSQDETAATALHNAERLVLMAMRIVNAAAESFASIAPPPA